MVDHADLFVPLIILKGTSGCTVNVLNESHVSQGITMKEVKQTLRQIARTNRINVSEDELTPE